MSIDTELSRLSQYSTIERLRQAISRPTRYSPEPFTHILPSFQLGQDGPALARLLLVSDNILCDVKLTEPGHSFDYIDKRTIKNYIMEFTTHEIKPETEGQPPTVFQICKITLFHGGIEAPSNFATLLEYVGNDVDTWVAAVLNALPVAIISHGL